MKSQVQIPFFLVTGFLGSGKTTLLRRFLVMHAKSRRIGVIQNEFAAGNVDGRELRETGEPFELLEVNKGSVFCVCLLSDFQKSLAAFYDRIMPDAVILEATGLADPIALGQMLQAPALRTRFYLAHVWCIVDAGTFSRFDAGLPRLRHQIRIADSIVINKTDKASASIEAIQRRVRELNPFARIYTASYCDVDLTRAFEPLSSEPVALHRAEEHSAIEPGGRPPVQSKMIRTTRSISKTALETFLASAASSLFRLKGYVNLDDETAVAVQCCFGETCLVEIDDYTGPSELVLIGPESAEISTEVRRLLAGER